MGEALVSRRGGGTKVEEFTCSVPGGVGVMSITVPQLIGAKNFILMDDGGGNWASSSGNYPLFILKYTNGKVEYAAHIVKFDYKFVKKSGTTFDPATGTINTNDYVYCLKDGVGSKIYKVIRW